jgi:hypothetical protein
MISADAGQPDVGWVRAAHPAAARRGGYSRAGGQQPGEFDPGGETELGKAALHTQRRHGTPSASRRTSGMK